MTSGLWIEASGGTVHWLDAAGGVRLRAAHWPTGARGTVLVLNGRTEFIEKYLEPIKELQTRGFAVWTLDWRGQGASSRLLPDPLAHHVERFDDYLDDLALLLDRHVLPSMAQRPGAAQKLVMLAHSMGGHLGAHLLARRPALFERAILCSPMIGFIPGARGVGSTIHRLIQLACLYPGQSARPGPFARRQPHVDRPFEDNPLTSCRDRYNNDIALQRAAPGLVVGGFTWGWLRAALASIAVLQQPKFARRITMPVLLIAAGDDRLVDNRATERFARSLPAGQFLTIQEARHELLREHDRHRIPVWAAIDQFLQEPPA